MNSNWKDFLQLNGATLNDDGLFDFNAKLSDSKLAENEDIICDLSHFSTVVIAGEDAADFMQGQFTNDVANVNENISQLSGFCNNKGRMTANFRLFHYQQNFFISLRSDLVEPGIKHLQNYVMRAQVAIQDVSEQLIHIGISGKNSADRLSPFIDSLNDEIDSVSNNENYIAIRVADKTPRYEIFCSLDHAKVLWEAIAKESTVVNSSRWEFMNINSGLPFIDINTSEDFVPQMANMELINGINFEKGCYTGQEIVARTHFLGKQKRRTYHIKITSETEPKAGEQLATDVSTENQYTGTLVTVYQSSENEYHALAVIQIKSAEGEKLMLKNAESDISVIELPYALVAEHT